MPAGPGAEEVADGHAEYPGDLPELAQPGAAYAVLDPLDDRAAHPCLVGECLLGEVRPQAQRADAVAGRGLELRPFVFAHSEHGGATGAIPSPLLRCIL